MVFGLGEGFSGAIEATTCFLGECFVCWWLREKQFVECYKQMSVSSYEKFFWRRIWITLLSRFQMITKY